MKTLLSLVSLVCLILASSLAGAQSSEFTVPLTDPGKKGKLKAHLNSGTIIVKGTARKDVLVRYSLMQDDDSENDHDSDDDQDEANKSLTGLKRIGGAGIDLEVTEHENTVKAQSDSWNQPLKLEIEVPTGFDLQLYTYNDGDLYVTGINGTLELTNFNGEITALNISGSVVANTYNGDIKVTFDQVNLSSPMSYSTFNGDIDLTLPTNVKISLKLKTEQGDIFSDFDIQLKSSGPAQKSGAQGGVYKVTVDEWKRGDINGGGMELTARNFNGNIILRKK